MDEPSTDDKLELFSKSSMSVVELNNFIVSLRPVVKRAKQQTIQKLITQIKKYRGKKGTDEQIAANNKKADRLLMDVKYLKILKIDKASKYSLSNTLTLDEATKKNNFELKVLTRIACHKLVANRIASWRQDHSDWESLAAFAHYKSTGRRYKKKKPKTSSAITDVVLPALAAGKTDIAELAVGSDVGNANCADSDTEENMDTGSWNSEDEDRLVDNDDNVSVDSEAEDFASVDVASKPTSAQVPTKSIDSIESDKSDAVKLKLPAAMPDKARIKASQNTKEARKLPVNEKKSTESTNVDIASSLLSSSVHKDEQLTIAMTKPEVKTVLRPSPIVRQITLDELSDEELFLPPPDDLETPAQEKQRRRKAKGAFFVGNDDEDGEDSSGSEGESANEKAEGENSEGEDATGKTVRVCDIKSSTRFAKSLAYNRGGKSRGSSYSGTGSRGGGHFRQSFNHGNRGGKMDGSGRSQQRGKCDRRESGGRDRLKGKDFDKRNGKNFPSNRRGRNKSTGQADGRPRIEKRDKSFGDKRPAKLSNPKDSAKGKSNTGSLKPIQSGSAQNEKLHPSWAASKERKEREKNVFVKFQGTKKTFADD